MASGIVNCKGEVFDKGDRLQTEEGYVFDFAGGMVVKGGFFDAERCVKVQKDHPLGWPKAKDDTVDKRPPPIFTDCVVWGL